MTASSKRPEHVAWASLILSLVFFGIAYFLGRWSGFLAVSAVGWQILAATLIWLVLATQFHQRSLAEQEKLDMGQLAREKETATIFQGKGERATLLAAAQRRLNVLERWFIPIFAGLIAAYEAGIGLYLLKAIVSQTDVETQQPLVCAVAMTAVAFVSFLLSRYATGMSAEPRWKPLRAGGSFLLGVALLCFAVALSLAGVHFQRQLPIKVVTYIIPILLMILGVETALNVVLDIYRPRLKGQYSRAAFDGRLLGIINEPGGVFRSLAAAMDYQFGFQVSQTWFYKLLEKAIVPLILFSVTTLYLASCIVVVAPDEEAIIERFGNPLKGNDQAGPGLHFKLPWPIDVAYKYRTKQVREIYIGYVPKTDKDTGRVLRESSLLWGQEHYAEEHSVLVATRQTGEVFTEGATQIGFSLIKANIPVQYRIKDLYAYIYSQSDPGKLFESICYQELTRFAASAVIEADDLGSGQSPSDESLFGAGRSEAKETLMQRIQEAADNQRLGIEVVFLGLQGVHPPPEVAPDYQAVIGAVQQKQAKIMEAQAERNETLSTLAGSVSKAYELADLAAEYQDAQDQGRTEDAERLGERFYEAVAQARGRIFKILTDAQSYAFEKATLAEAAGERFAGQMKAYNAAPDIYSREQRLAVLEEMLPGIRKYVVAAGPNDTEVIILDLQEKGPMDLLDVMGSLQESSGQ